MRRPKSEIRRYKLEQLVPRLRFLDVEASDGGPDAWPVEIGFASILADQTGKPGTEGWSSLIRPDPSWPEERWSRHAEAVHRIPRKSLDSAPDARTVAQELLEQLTAPGIVVVSDSPNNDQPWLDRLLETRGGAGRIRILSVWQALNGLVEQENTAAMKAWLKANKGPHRAGEDAKRLARAVIECHLSQPAAPQPPAALYHGTASEFESFDIPASGLHFGTFDQAAHAATLKLGQIPAEKFASRQPDSRGWRGRVLSVRITPANPKMLSDPKDPDSWAREIETAQAEGHDAICYRNEFEGRHTELSWAVWDPGLIEVLDRMSPAREANAARKCD